MEATTLLLSLGLLLGSSWRTATSPSVHIIRTQCLAGHPCQCRPRVNPKYAPIDETGSCGAFQSNCEIMPSVVSFRRPLKARSGTQHPTVKQSHCLADARFQTTAFLIKHKTHPPFTTGALLQEDTRYLVSSGGSLHPVCQLAATVRRPWFRLQNRS